MYNFQHEGIMDIIQDCTDVGKLSCANISQRQPSILNWPGSRSKPTAFCHIDEAVEVVSQSGYGEQQGIINETEVDFVVCLVYHTVHMRINRLFAYCKGGNFNIYIWAWFRCFIC